MLQIDHMQADTSDKVGNSTTKENQISPVPSRIGFFNMGNTCYFNSALQVILQIHWLKEYLLKNERDVIEILLRNAPKICTDGVLQNILNKMKKNSSTTNANTEELKNSLILLMSKLHNTHYDPSVLTEDEKVLILNSSMTYQMIKILNKIWMEKHDPKVFINPISFKFLFDQARNKFFFGIDQHDAEEAYNCIIQRIGEELSQEKNVTFNTKREKVRYLLEVKKNTVEMFNKSQDIVTKQTILDSYKKIKDQLPEEALIVESFGEMNKFFRKSFSIVSEIFNGFLLSTIEGIECKHTSNKFDPFFSLSLELPKKQQNATTQNVLKMLMINDYSGQTINPTTNLSANTTVNLRDCMREFCKPEVLDDKNLWFCEKCNKYVSAKKKLDVWINPIIFVIHLKRFIQGGTRNTKDTRMVSFPTVDLDITDIISDVQKKSGRCFKYNLFAVVNHDNSDGNADHGHYYSYVHDINEQQWYRYNDVSVEKVDNSKVITSKAYILFYVRKDMLGEFSNVS